MRRSFSCSFSGFPTKTLIFNKNFAFFPMELQPQLGQCLPIISALQSHSDTTHSLGLLWTSDQPDAETSTFTKHSTQKKLTSITPGGIRTSNPNKWAAADPRLRPRGRWFRLIFIITLANLTTSAAGQVAFRLSWLFFVYFVVSEWDHVCLNCEL